MIISLHHVLIRIWKKRWQLSLTILFLLVEYYMLAALHETTDLLTDDVTSMSVPPSIPTAATSRSVVEGSAATKEPANMTPPSSLDKDSSVIEATVTQGRVAESSHTESLGADKRPAVDFPVMESPATETPTTSPGTAVPTATVHVVEYSPTESPATTAQPTKVVFDESIGAELPIAETHSIESPVSESPLVKVPVSYPTKKDCFLSSYSNDGIGHQMEAKISCLATALILNSREVTQGRWTYIHQPVDELQHGQDPSTMEELFGFSKIVTEFYDPETMELATRELLTWPPQPDDMIQVWNGLCPGNNEVTEKAIVFNADNCWDFLYCRNHPLPDEWYTRVIPVLRTTILQGASFVQQGDGDTQQNDRFFPHKTMRIPGRCFIVMHIRLGDAEERKMNGDWIHAMWQNLLTAQEQMNHQANDGTENSTSFLSYQLAIHSDGPRDTVLDMLKFSDEKVVFMERYEDINPGLSDDLGKTVVSLYCRNEEHATLMTTVYDMLTADIFITSDSSLSHAGSLLRNVTLHGPTIHPPNTGGEFREQLGTILGWYFLKKSETNSTMMLWSNHEWNAVDSSFWSDVFKVYFSHATSQA